MSDKDYQDYPSRPITFFQSNHHVTSVKENAGPIGAVETGCRKVLEGMGPILGQEIVLDKSHMGKDRYAPHAVAQSKPDGYSIGAFGFGRVWQPHFIKVPYRVKEDFSFIAHVWSFNLYWCVRPDAPWETWQDFISDARTRRLKVDSPVGHEHIFINQIQRGEGVVFDWRPRSWSTSDDLKAGRIDAAYVSLGAAAMLRAGELRALAYTGPWIPADYHERFPSFPDVPSFGSLGYPPTWWGMGFVGPRGLPEPIRQRLEDTIGQALDTREMADFFISMGWRKQFLPGDTFKKYVFEAYDQNAKLHQEFSEGLMNAEEEAW